MKPTLLILSAIGCLAAAILPADAQENTKPGFTSVKSYEGNFKIQLPGEPEYSASDIQTDVGPIKLHSFLVEKNEGQVAYFMFYSDYPEGTGKEAGAKAILANARDGVIGGDGTKKISEKEVKVGNHPGLEFEFEQGTGADKTNGAWRLYMVNDRMYQIGIISIGTAIDADTKNTIYKSFELLKK